MSTDSSQSLSLASVPEGESTNCKAESDRTNAASTDKTQETDVPIRKRHWSYHLPKKPLQLCADIANVAIAPCVIVMVGLPARGKTFMSRKLTRYLNWIGLDCKVFNVGEYRRQATEKYKHHDFFRPDNEEALEIREKCAFDCLHDLCEWLKGGGEVAVFDATNATVLRRKMIYEMCTCQYQFKTFFVESFCTDNDIIEANIREVKITGKDYQGMKPDDAVTDFLQRIHHYEMIYQPMTEELDEGLSFMKIYNQGERFLVNRVHGHIESRVVYYLMNIHCLPRKIYLTRHGETDMNLAGRIGGDGDLSENGRKYAKELGEYAKRENLTNLRVWTSYMNRTAQTAEHIDAIKEPWRALNEIDAGVCEGLTYEEIEERFPEEFSQRDQDKYHYRYTGGESYMDLVARLEPVIMELERQQDVMVICHQAVARCLLAYFMNIEYDELPYVEVPLHTVMKLEPVAYGCLMETIKLNVDAVDTHRPRPASTVPKTMDKRQEVKARRKLTSECEKPRATPNRDTES